MSTPLKIAVIGVGTFGSLHARTLSALPEAELTAIIDSDSTKASRLGAELGVNSSFSSLRELIESRIAEAVVIATRTDTHIPLAMEAMNAGLHVLIEKPVGADSAEIAAFEKFCESSVAITMAGHICLFHSLTAPLIKEVRNKSFRAVNFVRHRPAQTALHFTEEHPFRMTMIHDLYVLAEMVGNEEPVDFDALDRVNGAGTADMSWATLSWADGRVATLQSHWTLPTGSPGSGWDCIEIFGEDYHAHVTTNPQNTRWTSETTQWPHGLEISEIDGRPTGMLAEELRAFVAACQGKPIPAGARISDAAQVQRWVERLMESSIGKRSSQSTK